MTLDKDKIEKALDDSINNTTGFDKEAYWANRRSGNRGQLSDVAKEVVKQHEYTADNLPPGAKLSFGEDGTLVVKNRAYRRQKTRIFPKSSQLRKKNKRK